MDILKEIVKKAKVVNATIVLPEAHLDERVKSAAEIVLKKKISKLIVFGKPEDYPSTFASENCQIINIESYEKLEELTSSLYELRKAKGMTEEDAKKYIQKPSYHFSKDTLLPLSKIKFENREYKAPNNPIKYVELQYGNYQIFPDKPYQPVILKEMKDRR